MFLIFNFSVSYAKSNNNEYQFVVISDTHVGALEAMNLAPEGYNHKNDLDEKTFVTLLNSVKESIKNEKLTPKSIFILGDLVDHFDGDRVFGSYSGREIQLTTNFKHFYHTFGATPLVYVFGNNDSLSGDYQSFYSALEKQHTPYDVAEKAGWINGSLSSGVKCDLKNTVYPCLVEQSQDTKNGFYVVHLAPKLRLIALNTVLLNAGYIGTYHGDHYNGEFEWLDNELKNAHNVGDSVLLAMHIPPGINMTNRKLFWVDDAENAFRQILNKYKNTTIGVLVGHTHMEELRIMVDDNHQVIPVIFTAGLSTSHGNAPSFKYFTLVQNDKDSRWSVKNYHTYYFSKNKFLKLYDFDSLYCPSIKAISVSSCMNHYVVDNNLPCFLKKLNQYYTAGNPNNSKGLSEDHPNDLLIPL